MKNQTLTPEEAAFLNERAADRRTIAVGYLSHLDTAVSKAYAAIYRKYIDKDFVLTLWCDDCRYRMVKKVFERFA